MDFPLVAWELAPYPKLKHENTTRRAKFSLEIKKKKKTEMSSHDLEQVSSFKEYVMDWKRDAERQEALVEIVAQILDQESRKNDLQVVGLFDSVETDWK